MFTTSNRQKGGEIMLYLALYEDERRLEWKARKVFEASSDEDATEKAGQLRESFWDLRQVYRLSSCVLDSTPYMPAWYKKRLDVLD